MTYWPHMPTPLSEREKQAYRYLLYQAMLDVRILCQSRGSGSYNPWAIWQQYCDSRIAGALADWLHNLAQHAITDFETFDAVWFWREYEGSCDRAHRLKLLNYRQQNERYLKDGP